MNGNIAVSRSIGDRDHKPYVSADADSAVFDLEGYISFFFISACFRIPRLRGKWATNNDIASQI